MSEAAKDSGTRVLPLREINGELYIKVDDLIKELVREAASHKGLERDAMLGYAKRWTNIRTA